MHYCPNCKRSFNDEEKLFCPKCGTPLVEKTVCQYCYAANLPDHAFCVKCGKLLTKPENDGEEKIAKNVLVTPELQQGQNLVDQSLAFAQESRERQQFSKCKDKGTSKLERDENTDVLQGTTVTYQKKNGSSNRDNKTTNENLPWLICIGLLVICIGMYYVCFSKPEAKAIIEKAKTFDGWTTIKMNNEIEFQIPPNLEIQDAKYKSLAKTANPNLYALSILNGDNEIVVQQKGLNSLNKEAFKHFVRAIIDIKDSLEELPAYGDSLILTDKELKDFTEKYINETHYIEKAFVEAEAKHRSYKLLTVNSPFKVTKVNGVDCLYIAYDSQFSNEPIFKCEKYIFYNRKKVYTLTTMVRSTEYELWTTGNTDVRNIVKTFHLIKNTPLQNNGVNKNTDSVLQPKPKELTKDNITAIPNRINIVAVDAPGYILGDDVNIRTMPGTDSQIIGRVQRGFRLHIISYEDGWAKVEDTKGNVGYVAKQYISTNGTDVDWSKGDKYGKSAYSGVVKATDVNMRESNSINSRVIGTFQQGEHVKVLGFYKEWVKVQRNNGQVGYIMRSYLGY